MTKGVVMSQKTKILEYLQTHSYITPLTALNEIGCLSLSQRVGELLRDGHNIVRSKYETASGKIVGKYFLKPGEQIEMGL